MKRAWIPFWVLLLSMGIAAIDPLQHVWLSQLPDERTTLTTQPRIDERGTVDAVTVVTPNPQAPTGFHIGDTPFFLTAMDLFNNNFRSPYADCSSEAHDMRRFALPHHWLYAALGWGATHAGVAHFSALGYANAFCGFLYLMAVWCFLFRWRPAAAPTAFVVFVLGGGLAGVLYLGAFAFGLSTTTDFEGWFHRYARYELIEGPFIAPVLVMPRLYYTLPLALGFGTLAMLLGDLRKPHAVRTVAMLVLLALTTLLNARLGPFFLFAAWCLLYANSTASIERRLGTGLALALPVAIVVGLVSYLFSYNPSGAENVALLLRRTAWFGSVASALFWVWPLIAGSVIATARAMPFAARVATFGAVGYLLAFAAGYLVHQVYWGNLFAGGDTAAAIAVSDTALLGVIPGVCGALFMGRGATRYAARFTDVAEAVPSAPVQAASSEAIETNTAALLWALTLLAVAISAFGGGVFMQLMPERCLVLIGVPLAVLVADSLLRLADRNSFLSGTWVAIIVISGLISIGVGALFFQGPYRHSVAPDAPFAWAHSEVMPRAAANTLAHLGAGTVLAPAGLPPFLGDVAVHQAPNRSTVFGQPSLEFSGRNMMALAAAVQHFYDASSSEKARMAFVATHCVDWILVSPGVFPGDFQVATWLEVIHEEDGYYLFRVRKDAL